MMWVIASHYSLYCWESFVIEKEMPYEDKCSFNG